MAKSGMAYDSVPLTLLRQLPNGHWLTVEGEAAAAREQERDAAGWARVRAQLDAKQEQEKNMAAYGRNNLCAMDGLTGQPIDPRDVPNSPVGGGSAERIKSFLAQRLTPSDLREFEALIAVLQGAPVGTEGGEEAEDDEGQEVAHPVRTTGPIGVVPGTRMRDRGDPVGEDDDLGVLTARGPTDARGRRVSVDRSGVRRAQQMAHDEVARGRRLASHARAAAATREYEQRWPGRFVSKCDV
jgi:hypothetical protein